MSQKLVLYVGEKNISSWSMRGWLALALKGVPFDERLISLREDRDRSRRRKVSPTGRVPVLHHGERVIPDSLAIIEYLEETFPPPKHPALWPSAPEERAEARWLSATMHAGFTRLREAMSFNLCFLPRRPFPPQEALSEAAEMLLLWEERLSRNRGDGRYLFGPFGAVDIMYAPAVVRLHAFGVPTSTTPRAATYMRDLLDHPLVKRWMDAARSLSPIESV